MSTTEEKIRLYMQCSVKPLLSGLFSNFTDR